MHTPQNRDLGKGSFTAAKFAAKMVRYCNYLPWSPWANVHKKDWLCVRRIDQGGQG
jgi:hypothetical protein